MQEFIPCRFMGDVHHFRKVTKCERKDVEYADGTIVGLQVSRYVHLRGFCINIQLVQKRHQPRNKGNHPATIC
jgi:hypothetical protein